MAAPGRRYKVDIMERDGAGAGGAFVVKFPGRHLVVIPAGQVKQATRLLDRAFALLGLDVAEKEATSEPESHTMTRPKGCGVE